MKPIRLVSLAALAAVLIFAMGQNSVGSALQSVTLTPPVNLTPVPMGYPATTPAPLFLTDPVVTTLEDDNSYTCTIERCTLRAAVHHAAEGATVRFAPDLKGRVTLLANARERIRITRSLRLLGNNQAITLARPALALSLSIPDTGFVEMDGFVIDGSPFLGFSRGTIQIRNCLFLINNTFTILNSVVEFDNTIFQSPVNRFLITGAAKVTIRNSFLVASPLGIISLDEQAELRVENSTIVSKSANRSPLQIKGKATFEHVTFRRELPEFDLRRDAAFFELAGTAQVAFRNSIFDSVPDFGHPMCAFRLPLREGRLQDAGGNVQAPELGCVGTVGDPKLSPLGDYGGVTPSYVLLPGSAAIGAAVGCPTRDQRGAVVPDTASGCDAGAFQTQGKINQ